MSDPIDGMVETIQDLEKQVETLWQALRPFYGFGAVLETANEDNGYAWITLADGNPEFNEPEDSEVSLESIQDESCIVTVNASWRKFPGTYCGPMLRAKHFFAARDAFMAINWLIERDEKAQQRK